MLRSEPVAAVVTAAVVCYVIGGLWFSPALFGKIWMRELRVTDEPRRSTGALLAIPASLAAAFGLGVVIASANITDLPRSLIVAVLVWACFTVAIELPAFALERAPRRLAIGAGHKLVAYLAIAAVFGLWS